MAPFSAIRNFEPRRAIILAPIVLTDNRRKSNETYFFNSVPLPAVSRKREMLEAYLEDVIFRSMDILPYDERAAEWHAEQRSKLSLHGKMPSFVDGQIAAITRVNDLILVTRNAQDFKLFDNFRILNWHKTG